MKGVQTVRRFCTILLLVAVLASPVHAAGPADDPEAAFEAFWTLYDEHYALFGIKRVDWDAVYTVYRPRVTEKTSRDQLFDLFSEVIDLLNDVHVSVRDEHDGDLSRSGGRSIGTGPLDNGEFSLDLIATAYAPDGLEARAAGLIHYGRLNGGAGYLHIRNFRHPTSTTAALDEIIAAFVDAPAVIIDVRQNGGGSDLIGRLVADRFAVEPALYMTVAERLPGPDRAAFAPPINWSIRPAESGAFTGPVIVLTNSRSISAAENFVLAMRVRSGAVIVGDITAGAMADTVRSAIPGGWTFTVPVNLVRDPRGGSWEGVGLAPDLWVRNAPADIAAGRDRVLDLAIALGGPGD